MDWVQVWVRSDSTNDIGLVAGGDDDGDRAVDLVEWLHFCYQARNFPEAAVSGEQVNPDGEAEKPADEAEEIHWLTVYLERRRGRIDYCPAYSPPDIRPALMSPIRPIAVDLQPVKLSRDPL